MRYIIDRFEEGFALLEPEEGTLGLVRVPHTLLPADAREGDMLVNGNGRWQVDAAATRARRERMRRRFSGLGTAR